MDVKLILLVLTGVFTVTCLFFGTKGGYYDTDKYDGNGSAHQKLNYASKVIYNCQLKFNFIKIQINIFWQP